MKNELSERKLRVLQEIVYEFIKTAEPVSSKILSGKDNFPESSATIRNEMADLETLGYLTHPHTSSGRIPSDKAYRIYVNELMSGYEIPKKEKAVIEKKLTQNFLEMNNAIQNLTKTLSEITNLTAFAITSDKDKKTIEFINITPASEETVLLTIIADGEDVSNTIIKINGGYDKDSLELLSKSMTYFYKGKTITDALKEEIAKAFLQDIKSLESVTKTIVPSFVQTLKKMLDRELYFDGIGNIFNVPEWNNLEKAKNIFDLISNKDEMIGILSERKDGLEITIGDENKDKNLKGNSLITATYHIDGKLVGKIGVIGPTRMRYDRITSLIKFLTDSLK